MPLKECEISWRIGSFLGWAGNLDLGTRRVGLSWTSMAPPGALKLERLVFVSGFQLEFLHSPKLVFSARLGRKTSSPKYGTFWQYSRSLWSVLRRGRTGL